jgi:UDP-N-acetylmuramate--alanine ligase
MIERLTEPGDAVICLGAGSITHWANALPEELRQRKAGAVTAEAS